MLLLICQWFLWFYCKCKASTCLVSFNVNDNRFQFFQIVVAFPDDGAWKRFHKQLDHFPMVSEFLWGLGMLIAYLCYSFHLFKLLHVVWWQVVCAKVREGDKRIVRLKEGNPAGCHVVIVDDLVQSGGTLIECQVILLFLNYL